MGSICFFANEGSRRSSGEFGRAAEALSQAGIAIEEAELCGGIEALLDAVRDRVESGAKVVFVGGGDGTLGAVSELFVGSKTVFGAVPLGTGNQFAREVGIPAGVEDAARTLAEGRVALIDLGTCNGHGFLTVATLGLTTEIARNLVAKAVLGKISYVPAVLKAMQSSKPFWARLEGEGETIEGEYLQLVISNGRTHAGPFLASPDATITDGMMDIYAVKPMGVGGIIGASVLALSGNHTKVEEIDAMKANRVVVETNPKLSVILDGEESWFDEMVFELNPAAIRAIVGPSCRLPQNRISTMSWD